MENPVVTSSSKVTNSAKRTGGIQRVDKHRAKGYASPCKKFSYEVEVGQMNEQDRLAGRMEDFRRACIARGIRLTHQRLEIFRELASTDEHPDVETIYRKVKIRIPTISLDTVYRNLRFMAEEGLIAVVGLSNERQRFDANRSDHHHFVCIRCGAIRDFLSEKTKKLTPPREAEEIGRPVSVRLEVKGICRECEKNT